MPNQYTYEPPTFTGGSTNALFPSGKSVMEILLSDETTEQAKAAMLEALEAAESGYNSAVDFTSRNIIEPVADSLQGLGTDSQGNPNMSSAGIPMNSNPVSDYVFGKGQENYQPPILVGNAQPQASDFYRNEGSGLVDDAAGFLGDALARQDAAMAGPNVRGTTGFIGDVSTQQPALEEVTVQGQRVKTPEGILMGVSDSLDEEAQNVKAQRAIPAGTYSIADMADMSPIEAAMAEGQDAPRGFWESFFDPIRPQGADGNRSVDRSRLAAGLRDVGESLRGKPTGYLGAEIDEQTIEQRTIDAIGEFRNSVGREPTELEKQQIYSSVSGNAIAQPTRTGQMTPYQQYQMLRDMKEDGDADQKTQDTATQAVYGLNNAMKILDEYEENLDFNSSGLTGAVLSNISGTDAYDQENLLNTIFANMGINKLGDIRANAANGASGFGQLTERELARIEGYYETLTVGGSQKAQRRAILGLKEVMTMMRDKAQRDAGGQAVPQANTNTGNTGSTLVNKYGY